MREGLSAEHVITRQGRPMLLYAGLLHLAHQKGLNEIWTEPVQLPTPENGNVAVVKARVEVIQRDPDTGLPVTDTDGVAAVQTFTGIGDASPDNVGRNIVPHILRMAETRAKARALRDAVNAPEALADDPSDEEPIAQTRSLPPQGPQEATEAQGVRSIPADGLRALQGGGATPEQLEEILVLAQELELKKDQIERAYRERWSLLSVQGAEEKKAEMEKAVLAKAAQ